ncbi:TSUP family transporter [Desulfofundulus thermobenzoicus]|uniref:Probable membrane transporter protein n=2 Tax=Desulfofundulus thermobenzoicus TaxID=29376 RepID=A0A6N7IMW3_9FIRM|nr:sulfite exporter TauE/SafE family protein [Desulfofundulus thermobenzoicus]MQL51325.1 TSUP family transporter [Desulfofundulus thermobenzoicus]HHW42630.1 sulfite exporter TauE/SafE family protein [Desulfotomaculum sp.]
MTAYLVLGLGGIVGLLSGLFGVGGGFLLTPLLMMAGIPPAVAAASDTNQIVAASASGTFAHGRAGNVDFKLGLIMLVGGLIGGTAGTGLVRVLRQLGNFDFVVKIVYVLMLLVVGSFMFMESFNALRKRGAPGPAPAKKPGGPGLASRLPMKTYFPVSGIECSVVALFGLGFLIGVLAALMGVGGGFIMLPVMIYILGIPTLKAVGTSLFTVVFTAVNVTLAQAIVNETVDVVLALLLLLGSAIGAQFGVRIGRRLKGEQLRIIFSLIVLGVMVKMAHDLLVTPSSLIVLGGGH